MLSPLLALLFVTPALAETLDCAVIKSTTHPFELTFDWRRLPCATPQYWEYSNSVACFRSLTYSGWNI
jgi:hypothetical protein